MLIPNPKFEMTGSPYDLCGIGKKIVITCHYCGEPGHKVSHVAKIDNFMLLIFMVPNLRSVAQNEWKKHPYVFFFTFGSKINEFERKKSEKNEKIPKS